MKWRLAILGGFLTTIVLPIFQTSLVRAGDATPNNKVIISEVKLGGDSYSQGADQPKDPQEFVTLFNQGANEVKLDGWVLEYAKTTFDKTFCTDNSWIAHNVSSSASQTALSGTLQPGQVSTPIVRSLTDNAAGSLHLVNGSDKNNLVVEDLVGWGGSAPCIETASAATPSNGKSIKRYLDCNNLPIDSGNNAQDFATNQPPSPGALGNPYITSCQDAASGSPTQTQQTCEGIVISELLPNPSGSDTNNEFIELYNPTTLPIPLQGCSLQTTGNSKVYNFGNTAMQPGEYHAFYNNETGLTLPNSAGGTAWLLSPSTELQAIIYPANMADDVSWSLVSTSWQATYQPTPNAANILVAAKPCPEGEGRNLDTGYCRSLATLTTSTLSVCKVGQERSPETNRCRSTTTSSTSSSTLVSCKPGQERNPATNRCKAIATTASAALKPCAPGQERSPTTNRCKKSAQGSTLGLSSVKDTVTGSVSKNPHLWLAGFAVVGATGYGVYEWRQEVLLFFSRLRNRLPGT
jgi:hypothetical protein